MTRVLLLGATGLVGSVLRRGLAEFGELHAPCRREADFEDPEALAGYALRLRPGLIVNAAGYTRVDDAESDRETAFRVNAEAPAALARAAAGCGALLVHYSTDYVFDGRTRRPYREDDPTAPLNFYGQSKRAGERAVLAVGARALVLRIGWVFGRKENNILQALLRRAEEGLPVRMVGDQVGTPTWRGSVAEGTLAVLRRVLPGGRAGSGLFHMTCAGEASRCDFARAVLGDAAPVEEIRSAECPRPAKRPPYSVLDNRRLEEVFGVRLPDWREALRRCRAEEPPPGGRELANRGE